VLRKLLIVSDLLWRRRESNPRPDSIGDHLHRPRPGASDRCCGKSLDREEVRFEDVFQKTSCKFFTAMGLILIPRTHSLG